MHGDVTKDEYESTLRTYHKNQAEMKSEARDRDKYVLSKADDANKKLEIFAGIMPFLAIVIFAMFLMYLFPGIALWLPDILFAN